jgi:hypothetical protein
MDGGSTDHAGAVICRHAGEWRVRWALAKSPAWRLLQRFYQDLCMRCYQIFTRSAGGR